MAESAGCAGASVVCSATGERDTVGNDGETETVAISFESTFGPVPVPDLTGLQIC